MVESFSNVKIAPFNATHATGLIVTNSEYDKIGMENLDGVKDNFVTMKRHFDFLGIKDVIEVTDSLEDMMKAYDFIHN